MLVALRSQCLIQSVLEHLQQRIRLLDEPVLGRQLLVNRPLAVPLLMILLRLVSPTVSGLLSRRKTVSIGLHGAL